MSLLVGKHKNKDSMTQSEFNFLKIKFIIQFNLNVSQNILILYFDKVEFDI
jgi:hypothetical protein